MGKVIEKTIGTYGKHHYNIRGFVREKSSNAGGFSSTLGMIFQKSDCGDFMGILKDFMGEKMGM
jgi:hypothetical protein